MPLINSSYLFLHVQVKLARILRTVSWLTAWRLVIVRREEHLRLIMANPVIVDAYVRTITEGPFIRSNDSEGLAKLASSMRNYLIACSGLASAELHTQHTVCSVFKRLPKSLQKKLTPEVSSKCENNKLITFKDLTEFVERHARMKRSFFGQLSLSKGDRKHDHDRRQEPVCKKKVFTTFLKIRTKTSAQQTPSCPECKENHGIWRSPFFQKLSVQDRWKSVKLNRLCFNWLGRHISHNCKFDCKCRKCGRRHHTMLHSDSESRTSVGSGSSSDSAEMVEQQHGTCASGKNTGTAGTTQVQLSLCKALFFIF